MQLRNFFGNSTWKKLAFSLLQFYDAAKARKKPSLKQTKQLELNSVSNMPAKIDIDALKIFTRSRTNKTEYWQKIKNSQSQLKIYRFLKGRAYRYYDLLTFEKVWNPKT